MNQYKGHAFTRTISTWMRTKRRKKIKIIIIMPEQCRCYYIFFLFLWFRAAEMHEIPRQPLLQARSHRPCAGRPQLCGGLVHCSRQDAARPTCQRAVPTKNRQNWNVQSPHLANAPTHTPASAHSSEHCMQPPLILQSICKRSPSSDIVCMLYWKHWHNENLGDSDRGECNHAMNADGCNCQHGRADHVQ